MAVNDLVVDVRGQIENIMVSVDGLGEGYNDWEPDLRVDPRLRDCLVKAVQLIRTNPDFGQRFRLPVSSCYRPFLSSLEGHWKRDASDPRGHWSGLAIDIGYRNVLPEGLWRYFEKCMEQAGLKRIHYVKYGEWWHFSDYGTPWKKWRPANQTARLRGEICRQLGII